MKTKNDELLSVDDFYKNSKVVELLKQADELLIGKEFSDIIDDDGHQYVDLVQEGGGVLGIALVGYVTVLEHVGIRFFNLAGTSAGAINTMLMACVGKINEPVSRKILESFVDQNLFDFVDGHPKLKHIVQQIIDGKPKGKIIWKLIFSLRKVWNAISHDLGLNPGKSFYNWLHKTILGYGVSNVSELIKRRKAKEFPKSIKLRDGKAIKDDKALVHIITADITTKSKVRFPEMANLYWNKDELSKLSPAHFVRASMSVPFFFKPYVINNLPHAGEDNNEDWMRLTLYHGPIPQSASFVDGGMISNFPINVFHRNDDTKPRKPTFGVKLSEYRNSYSTIDSLGSLLGAMVSTMRHDADTDYLIKNNELNQLICCIDADKEFKWLNFKMTNERKIELFIHGAEKALSFLRTFDWKVYKNAR